MTLRVGVTGSLGSSSMGAGFWTGSSGKAVIQLAVKPFLLSQISSKLKDTLSLLSVPTTVNFKLLS